MKTPLCSMLLSMFFCLLIIACQKKETTQQFTVDFTAADGSKESHTMTAGSMVLVRDGDMQMMVEAVNGTDQELDLQVTQYTVSQDTTQEFTLRKASDQTSKVAVGKSSLLSSGGTVQVNLQTSKRISQGTGPQGGCGGDCCTAKCFTLWCCSDQHECKDTTCDCKPPSNCPTQPVPPIVVAKVLEMHKGGRDVMTFR